MLVLLLLVTVQRVPAADAAVPGDRPFVHPGLLHGDDDLKRMRTQVAAQAEPWLSGWNRLLKNPHAQLTWKPRPVAVVYRGFDREHRENYGQLFNDAAAAYATALRWQVSGDTAYADKAVEILDAWGGTLTAISGNSDSCLAAGIYGYQLANAAELLCRYPGWPSERRERFTRMMVTVFAAKNHDFLVRHNGTKIDHYWANWDLCNLASLLAIGVLADRRDLYQEAVDYYQHGAGNGAITKAVWQLYPQEGLGQWQESGRDQPHTVMGVGLAATICEMAWHQGDDLYGLEDNRLLKGAQYVARYNLMQDVPYTTYTNSDVSQAEISAKGRGDPRPVWELIFNHYVGRRHLAAPDVARCAAQVRPEGGGGDYGPNSGGFDQLGYGTLTATLLPPVTVSP